MNISDMIDLMGTLGIGQVHTDVDSKRILLQYLNLANDELYRETANINSDIFVNDPALSNIINTNVITIPRPTFSISRVYLVGYKRKLKPLSVLDFADYQYKNTESGEPEVYTKIGNKINFHPIIDGTVYIFNIWSTPERTLFEANTPESAIPYTASYQSVLINGALYYLFQDESGFKNPTKENEALKRWKDGKTDLKSYLYGSNNQLIRTFENA